MKRLIIDCDPGNGIAGANVDDGLALALAMASPDISLELITIVAGNTPVEVGYRVAQDLVARLGLTIPVHKGESQALREPAEPWRQALDQRVHQLQLTHLWHGVREPMPMVTPEQDAVDAIGQLICDNPGEITLVAIGPLTNVARAMQRYPQLAESVAEIAIMGGVFALDDYLKDTNFGLDPEAAHQVLNSGAAITLVPMDATTQTLMTHQDLDRIAQIDKPLARFVSETFRPWIDYSIKTRNLPGCWIHDALVVAWLLNQRVATASDYLVDVELHAGPTRGKSWRYRHPLRVTVGIEQSAGGLVHVLQTVDNQLLLTMLEQALAGSAF
ncbi:inosine-uridine nucleoside N-ribohydrolase [Erwinia toletana]|uniref:Inosine-uridine nucleoside N-ribohydrolase n=1 Tax=Winslowiella toletana TaxID=92490 RepID=A0ABS4PBS6_9GAMM|nr:nucleoside hydrolase [Winslowiella toletana]MBP2169627.1 inosine-uridine nucleoside N-ribohydrolase [Winslowiella toletana]